MFYFLLKIYLIPLFGFFWAKLLQYFLKGVCCFSVGTSQLWCGTLWKYVLCALGSGATSSKGKQRRQLFKNRAWGSGNQEISSETWWNCFQTLWCISFIYFLFVETGHSLELSRNRNCWKWLTSLAVYQIIRSILKLNRWRSCA